MKYRLVKEYPGSPKLGTVVEEDDSVYYIPDDDSKLSFTELDHYPYAYPEFWELVVEKDYEILSFNITNPNKTNTLLIKHSILKDYFCFQNEQGPYFNLDEILNKSHTFKIHSIKRLSDGEIFTIGDKLEHFIIESFKFEDFGNGNQLTAQDKNGGIFLSECKKFKQLIFQTIDRVNIYENDIYFRVASKNIIFNKPSKYKASSKNKYPDHKYPDYHINFSTKEKAEEYILLNKPCLSILEIYRLLLSAGVGLSGRKEKELEDLVKSKIQQSV